MDGLSGFGWVGGIIVAVLSAAFSYTYRQRYKTLVTDIYQPGNDELRQQLKSTREEKSACQAEVAEWKAKYGEQEKLIATLKNINSKQADFAGLTKLISNNHKVIMQELASITKEVVRKGKK